MAKKGQMEILGIAVIIVLVILGFLFMLRFATPGEAANLKERLGRAQIANNVLSAMLKTGDKVCDPLKKPKIEELLIDCAENKGNGGSVVCQGKLSCAYVREKIEQNILAKSIGKWKLGYEFSVKQSGAPLFNPILMTLAGTPGKCPATAELDVQ